MLKAEVIYVDWPSTVSFFTPYRLALNSTIFPYRPMPTAAWLLQYCFSAA